MYGGVVDLETGYDYKDISKMLMKDIEGKVYKPGEKLPSENKLSDMYKVKRFVVRKAINKLVSDGLVYVIRNKGYYVRLDQINVRIHKDASYTRNMLARGLTPKVKLLEITTVFPDTEQKTMFGLNDGEMLWYIHVLRYYKNVPYFLGESYIPFGRFPGFGAGYQEKLSIYKVFSEIYGISPQRKSSVCRAAISDKRESRLLSVFEHSPVLKVKSINTDRLNIPVEQCISTFRSDIVQLNINL